MFKVDIGFNNVLVEMKQKQDKQKKAAVGAAKEKQDKQTSELRVFNRNKFLTEPKERRTRYLFQCFGTRRQL